MVIRIKTEAQFSNSIWCSEYLKGIRHEASLQSIRIEEQGEDYQILVGSSNKWISQQFHRRNTVLITPDVYEVDQMANSVSVNFHQAMTRLSSYFTSGQRERTILFGVNPMSAGDAMKGKCFSTIFPDGRIFQNQGNLMSSVESVLSQIDSIDSIICCNGLISVLLCKELVKYGVKVPDDVWIIGFGHTSIGQLLDPSISSIDCDYFSVGKHAVKACMLLTRNPKLASISMTIDFKILPGGSTGFWKDTGEDIGGGKQGITGKGITSFYEDEDVKDLIRLEELFTQCRKCDAGILKGLEEGIRYCDLSDELNMSENTLKYRIRRMIEISKCSSRQELLDLIARFFSCSTLEKKNIFDE
jgi:hypothetical protein